MARPETDGATLGDRSLPNHAMKLTPPATVAACRSGNEGAVPAPSARPTGNTGGAAYRQSFGLGGHALSRRTGFEDPRVRDNAVVHDSRDTGGCPFAATVNSGADA